MNTLRSVFYNSFTFCVLVVFGCSGPANITVDEPPAHLRFPIPEGLWPGTETWAFDQLERLTLEQKVSQIFNYAVDADRYLSNPDFNLLNVLVEQFEIGGLVFNEGSSLTHAGQINKLQRRADIPLLIGLFPTTTVGAPVTQATDFPSRMAFGATRNPNLAYAAGRIAAQEARASGFHHASHEDPTDTIVSEPIDTGTKFSEHYLLDEEMHSAYQEGLQDGGLLSLSRISQKTITCNTGTDDLVISAIASGTDMIVCDGDTYSARAAVLNAIREGRLTESRIDESLIKILMGKRWFSNVSYQAVYPSSGESSVGRMSNRVVGEYIARESITLLRNENDLLPLDETENRIISIAIIESEGPPAGHLFAQHLRRHVDPTTVQSYEITDELTADDREAVLRATDAFDLIVVPVFTSLQNGAGTSEFTESLSFFVNMLIETEKPVIVVSFGDPGIIRFFDEPDVYITAYGAHSISQKAVVEALFGKGGFPGRLPVSIPDRHAFGTGILLAQSVQRPGLGVEVGMDDVSLEKIETLLYQAVGDSAFPGAALAVGRGGVLVKLQGVGHFTYESEKPITPRSLFDLASLTKAVATTTATMMLYEEGLLDLDATVASYLPAFAQNGKENITMRQLMSHTAGLIPFRPFYAQGVTTRQDLIDAVCREELLYEPGTESRYSDFGPILMALIIEKITGMGFDEYTRQSIFEPLEMYDTGFRGTGISSPDVVPTELDDYFRMRLIQGEVHDENAWVLGGTAGHAGLFSTATDLAKFAYMLANKGLVKGRQFISEETLRLFTTPVDPEKHTRALGWDTRPGSGPSSAGAFFGPNSFGHTGFTGTSMWIDPDAQLFVILLTNRIYPRRDNNRYIPVRSSVADIAYLSIRSGICPLMPMRR